MEKRHGGLPLAVLVQIRSIALLLLQRRPWDGGRARPSREVDHPVTSLESLLRDLLPFTGLGSECVWSTHRGPGPRSQA